jgi:hypothetical protein
MWICVFSALLRRSQYRELISRIWFNLQFDFIKRASEKNPSAAALVGRGTEVVIEGALVPVGKSMAGGNPMVGNPIVMGNPKVAVKTLWGNPMVMGMAMGMVVVMAGNLVLVVGMLDVVALEVGTLAVMVGKLAPVVELLDVGAMELAGSDASLTGAGNAWTARIKAREVKIALNCISGIWSFCFCGLIA